MKRLILLWLLLTSATYTVNFEGPMTAPMDMKNSAMSVHFRSAWSRVAEGDFINTPSGHQAGVIQRCVVDESLRVYVSPPIYHLRFKYTGSRSTCNPDYCVDLGSFPIRVICYRPGGWWPAVAWQDFNEPGSSWETGCTGANYCQWHTAEMWFSEPVESFTISWAIWGAAYIDDLFLDTATDHTPAIRKSWGEIKGIYR